VRQLRPRGLAFAHHDGVGVPGGFVGQQGGVRPADDDGDAAAAVLTGQSERVRRGGGVGGDADYVYRLVEIDLLDDFVGVGDVPVAGGVGGQQGHGELGEADQPTVAHEAGGFGFCRYQFDAVALWGRWAHGGNMSS